MRKILIFMLLMTGLIPVFGSSSAHFYAERTSDTPDGAGYIYVYRGGGDNKSPNDKLTMPGSSDWKSSDSKFDAGEIEITSSSPADGYQYIDNENDGTSNTTIAALHMYFFAKANAGYRFDGWYDKNGNLAEGSTLHYPYPGKKYTGASSTAPSSPSQGHSTNYQNYISRWNNGTAGSTPPYSGIYNNEINYLRYVLLISQQNGNSGADITMYAKFSIIPRHFKFVGTGFDDVSYMAAGTTVGDTTIESGNITSNIALSLTYDATKYNFAGWQWSIGQNGARTDISSNASASYTFVADRGYSGDIVWIWPILTEKADAVATVKVGSADAVPYETWAEAFAAAKAVEGEDEVIVTLKKDVEGIDAIQEVTRDMTLDLNGHTITGSVNNMFTIKGSGTDFTLCDNTPSDAGRIVLNISGETTYALAVQSGAKLILQSGGVSATNTNEAGTSRGVEIQSGATLEMIGGTVYAQSAKNAYALINRGAATIGGGVLQTRAKGTSTKGTGVTCVAFLNNGTATINNGNFIANADSTTAYGIQHNVNNTMTVNNAIVNATTGKSGAYGLYRSNGKIVVNDIKVKATYSVNVANKEQVKLFGGVYKTFNNLRQCAATDHDCYELESGVDYTNGYRFVVKGLADNPNVCKLLTLSSTTYYTSLADALVEVAAHPLETQKIIMTAFEHTLPAGNYTIPAASALVVPYDAGQVDVQIAPVDVQSWASLSQYHLLTLAPGANITVNGSLAVGGQQFGTSSSNPGPGSVLGAYAVLDMSAGGHITIANGANLYAYGFIKGAGDQSASGTILIQSGGTVYENLVINDLHGGGGTAACVNGTSASNSYDLFPFSQYFIQNVEPKMTIEYGAHERAFYDIQSSRGGQQGSVNVIGNTSDYLFQLSAGASATKWYDATRDYQCYEVRGSMTMNGITVTAADNMSMSSNKFILPVNNNMSITVKEGAVLDLPYSIKFQPGSELIIEEGAIVDTHKELYFYDYQDWDKYACGYAQTFGTTSSGKNIPWHTLRDVSSAEALGHATLVVNGQLRIKDNGALYTSSHGGNITSTGSGKIIFNVAGKSANKNLYECWSTYGKREDGNALAQGETNKAAGQVQVGSFNLLKTWYIFGTPVECNPAKLRNSNDTYISTSGAVAGDIYQYCDGTWTKGGCITYHTIVWKNADGSVLETDENVPYGATPEYNGETPTKIKENYNCVFTGWDSEIAPVTGNATYTAQFIEIPLELVISGEYSLPAAIEVNTTVVKVSGDLDIEEGKSLSTQDLILEASENASGQIRGNGLLTATRNVYFDLHLNTAMRHWRAFTVPFEIDLKQHPILADGVSMPLGVQYDIVYYDGAERAAHGKTPDCWRYVEDDANWILTPGKAYMIVFGRDVNTVRFTKKNDASIRYTGTVSVAENHSDRSGGTDGGWNGIGNPATYHAMLNAGVTECQVHNGEEIGSDGYTPCDMGKFIVGKAVFVQVAAPQSVVVERATVSDELIKPQAPRRTNANASGKNRFDVQIAPVDGKMADRMFLHADEYKEDKYVILQDLAKAGLSTKRAQIWVDRYGTKLCKNTAVLTDGQAEYPLGIFAPAAGDYTIQVAERPDEETMLYLTFDGQAIWNLTYGDYVASLEKGTTNRYGLRLVRNTPQVATGMDEAVVDANGETRKVLINDQVFIIRGEKVYTIDGQLVK